MNSQKKSEDLTSKLTQLIESKITQILETSPAKDIEKNIRALLTQAFARLDLVTREEFDLQVIQLTQLQEKVEKLTERLAKLETPQS